VPPAQADFTFGAPVNIQSTFPFLDLAKEFIDCFPVDGLEMYIESNRVGGQGNRDLWVCKRASPEDDWGPPEGLGPTVNSAGNDLAASVTADGLELYFISDRPGGHGNYDLYVSKRATGNSPWGAAVNLGPKVNTSYTDYGPSVSSDGLELYLSSDRPGGHGIADIYVSKRATTQDPWGDPADLGPAVNSPSYQEGPGLSGDGLLLLFQSGRSGGFGNCDLWLTQRASRSAPWELAVNLGPMVNGPTRDCRLCLVPDGSALYFRQLNQSNNAFIAYCKVPILPTVDFNGDGKVDGFEVCRMANCWGTDDSLCDIGPMSWGDGIIDTNDLTVLAKYIGQDVDVNDPTLIAHWALDETGGMMAADSAGDSDAMVLGNAVWQPAEGKLDGALAFDGKDDFATTGKPVLDPAAGPFSAIAWVKGGGANRVIVSQASGADWLYLNQFGMLTTDLTSSDRNGTILTSDAYVLDDQWHRVALTWDGTSRTLYMDYVEVARDTPTDLKASSGKLLIGVGKTMAATSFWSGLIDEVRIYNRAVQP
jgi:hypothetical protein